MCPFDEINVVNMCRQSSVNSGAMAIAEMVADNVMIHSAKYGVVEPDNLISPYKTTLLNMFRGQRRDWAMGAYRALHWRRTYQNARTIIWLAGDAIE